MGNVDSAFQTGDRVAMSGDISSLQSLQKGHGEWCSDMEFVIGRVGVVKDVNFAGDVIVEYSYLNNHKLRFNPAALIKVEKFSVGDKVKILDDKDKGREYQENHVGWNEFMAPTLGKIGTVRGIDSDGDLFVSVAGRAYLFNHLCCTKVPQSTPVEEDDSDLMRKMLQDFFKKLVVSDLDEFADDHVLNGFVNDAATGNIQKVREFIKNQPSEIDAKCSGRTALHAASSKGHKDVVVMLLEAGANLEIQDGDRNTAVHHAVHGKDPEMVELLLSKGANIEAINKRMYNALHLAVLRESLGCVRVLLKHSASVNIQDFSGNTALKIAVMKKNERIIDMLISDPSIDFTISNKGGFNVLHQAAFKGNNFATERILQKRRDIVDIKMHHGFAALHIAAVNGYRDVTNTLLTVGQAQINIQNLSRMTPLYLAVKESCIGVVELLISKGADTNVEDVNGDTCLHQALSDTKVTIRKDSEILEQVRTELNLGEDEPDWLVIACYLVHRGADLHHKNHKDITPLDMVDDKTSREKLMKFAPKSC